MRIIIETEAEIATNAITTLNKLGEAIDAGEPSEDLVHQITEESLEMTSDGDGDAIDAGPPPQELVETIEGLALQEGEDAGAAPDNEV